MPRSRRTGTLLMRARNHWQPKQALTEGKTRGDLSHGGGGRGAHDTGKVHDLKLTRNCQVDHLPEEILAVVNLAVLGARQATHIARGLFCFLGN